MRSRENLSSLVNVTSYGLQLQLSPSNVTLREIIGEKRMRLQKICVPIIYMSLISVSETLYWKFKIDGFLFKFLSLVNSF